jgi:uncharacterized membrane protein YcaP (DUF421 family)
MDEVLRIALRVLFAYVVLHQLLRHAGNRTMASSVGGGAEGKGIDLILALIIGDLIDDLLWAEVPAAQFVTACGALVLLHILVGLLRYANTWWWKVSEGAPAPVLIRGAPERAAMRSERVNDAALAALLRREGVEPDRWPEVRAAYLENSGRLSVLRRRLALPATRADRERALKAAR